jgi:MoaA/NifB/PqqE/SkfB family radical SAM enzyme
MFKVTSRWPHQDSIKVEWNLGKRCNYDCSYCPSVIHDNTSEHTDINVLKSTVDKLATLGKPIRLSLTGGEPCVHPDIEELIQYIKSKDMWLSITTNGTRVAKWYGAQNVDQYVFSVHFEYEYIKTIQTITAVRSMKHDTNIVVNIMAHHDKMTDVRQSVTMLEQQNVTYNVRRIRWTDNDHDNFDDNKYQLNDLEWLMKQDSTVKPNTIIRFMDREEMYHANDVIKKHLNQYKDWTCYAGIESLMINWDGDVHRATCRVGGSLGNIYNDTFTQPQEPTVCDRNYCTCAADIPLTKARK